MVEVDLEVDDDEAAILANLSLRRARERVADGKKYGI